jgi:hypothetical protein
MSYTTTEATGNTAAQNTPDAIVCMIIPDMSPVTGTANRRHLDDELPPFDPVYITGLMNKARERIKERARLYPGVWAWAKQYRQGMLETVEKRKAEFRAAYDAHDLVACHKWLFYYEHAAKKIISSYAAVRHS